MYGWCYYHTCRQMLLPWQMLLPISAKAITSATISWALTCTVPEKYFPTLSKTE